MAKDSYQKRLERHLVEYKQRRLGVRENGEFVHNGQTYSKAHILPRELQWLNIPEPFRREVREYVTEHRIKLHKYFHHLNSSQALALALFGPYVMRAPAVLARALGTSEIVSPEFERIPDRDEGTNVDVSWSSRAVEVFCEVKLSEREFGPAGADERHKHKLATRYGPVLRDQVDAGLLEEPAFFKNYQILRNLWLAGRAGHERDRVIFLMPKANAGLSDQLGSVLEQVGRPLRGRVSVVYVESLLEQLAAETKADRLGWYARMLQEKYVLE